MQLRTPESARYIVPASIVGWLGVGLVTFLIWGPWAASAVLVVLAFAFGDAVIAAWVNRRVSTRTGAEAFVGRTATVFDTRSAGDRRWHGRVRIHGELWNAYADGVRPTPGEAVNVASVDGLKLRVESERLSSEQRQAAHGRPIRTENWFNE